MESAHYTRARLAGAGYRKERAQVNKTGIEWAEMTCNAIVGCSRVSEGCDNCYAAKTTCRMACNPAFPEYAGLVTDEGGWSGEVLCKPQRLVDLIETKQPQIVFLNSMSDVFHPRVPNEFIQHMFDIMRAADWHVYQMLTKRPKRMLKLNTELNWPKKLIMGTSIELNKYVDRADMLRKTDSQYKFLSLEPLLGPLPSLNLDGIDWVIVGGESGKNHREMKEEWVCDLRDKCVAARVPFFFKQWGGTRAKSNGNLLQGRQWLEEPLIMKQLRARKAA